MAFATPIPPSHVGTHSFQHDAGEPDPMEFPQLKPTTTNDDHESAEENDWEMVSDEPSAPPVVPTPPQVKFQLTKSQTVKQDEKQDEKQVQKSHGNPKCLMHSQSSPNLRDYIIEESDSDSEFEHVGANVSLDDGSSSFSIISTPPSVNSIWSSRISFKDALLKKDATSIPENATATEPQKKKPHGQHIKKIKPRFIVQAVAPMKHAKSMGDLSKLAEDEEILGDSDAHEYYSRKAQGSLGRQNGRKQRPDEAKRLEITMNKKNMQKARQGH
ncbi:unnamed protein product [Cylindrotheca closterium]|uniref:Uncharacterized protein n=1 Tax=Cylindrotheca closterium TaxID=2856 RepID=A0AAD2G4A2_9STRA|nr:unnamed protein product [Cylindrotheca closterium]